MLRTLLFICGHWPPQSGSGVLRSYKFAKYLSKLNWKIHVLTMPHNMDTDTAQLNILDNIDVLVYTANYIKHNLPVGDLDSRKRSNSIIRFYRNILPETLRHQIYRIRNFPDEWREWIVPARKVANKILEENKIDLIWSTSPPESCHYIGNYLKHKYSVPWLAELRDPWSDYHQYTYNPLLFLMHYMAERRILKGADALVTLTEAWRKYFGRRHRKKTFLVRCGFDPNDFPDNSLKNANNATKSTVLNIYYFGNIHKIYQSPNIFFRALSFLTEHNPNIAQRIRVTFRTGGYLSPDISNLANQYKIQKIISVLGKIEHKKALEEMTKADLLLLFDWKQTNEISRGVIPMKFYEYLGAKRPILLISDSDNSELVQIGKSLGLNVIPNSIEKIVDALIKFVNQKQFSGLSINYNTTLTNQFTRQKLANDMDGVLRWVIQNTAKKESN